ncbi:unnamed protein product [Spirodela intermedia]|uniref:Pantoate--beta-alanine ligase n=1 Tax=Spirodela intermedia TaxID=51605 RepID=A0ABN7E8D9_SPIIN|nr:unnamed protein product [Spirodela intermedia]
MQVCHSVRELRAFFSPSSAIKGGLCPDDGQFACRTLPILVTQAKQLAEIVVVSIFVNPLQFGVNEDFGSYPRTLAADCEQLEAVGADVVFAPTVTEMYPDFDGQDLRQAVVIQPPALANELCGASRPGHFVGVATVVAKLFNMVQPQVAVFGKKDYQQLMVIRTLVRQLNFNVEIVAGETVREPSGLAMSSRNGYLSATGKTQAAQLYQQLQRIKQALLAGQRDYASLCEQAVAGLNQQGWQVDYVDIRRQTDLTLPDANDQAWVILAAAKLGGTRLIDNCEVSL